MHPSDMSDDHTEDRAHDEDTAGDAGAAATPPVAPAATRTSSNRDWIIPVSLLGGLLVAALVFVAGFGIGRATADDDDVDEVRHAVIVPVNPGGRGGDGYGFGGFDRRGPGGQGGLPDMGRFGDIREMPGAALDRACTLLDEGAFPDQAPFIDRLTELCDARDA